MVDPLSYAINLHLLWGVMTMEQVQTYLEFEMTTQLLFKTLYHKVNLRVICTNLMELVSQMLFKTKLQIQLLLLEATITM